MSLGNGTESSILQLFFNATPIANMADNAASGPFTALFVALHVGDPGEAGTQATSEAAYGAYARVSVARTVGGWTVSGTAPTQVANAAAITFPACTSGSSTITHWSIGTVVSGATLMLVKGALTSPASLAVSTGITPSFAIGQLAITLE